MKIISFKEVISLALAGFGRIEPYELSTVFAVVLGVFVYTKLSEGLMLKLTLFSVI